MVVVVVAGTAFGNSEVVVAETDFEHIEVVDYSFVAIGVAVDSIVVEVEYIVVVAGHNVVAVEHTVAVEYNEVDLFLYNKIPDILADK